MDQKGMKQEKNVQLADQLHFRMCDQCDQLPRVTHTSLNTL